MLDSDQGVAVRALVIGVLDAIHAEGAQAEGAHEKAADAASDIGAVPFEVGDPCRHDQHEPLLMATSALQLEQ